MPETLEMAAGLELLDVIQLKSLNRFAGCISVQGDGFAGLVFFRDGQIIHAEAGQLIGEEAFYAIAQRPSTTFSLQPNVATTQRSIRRSWQYLVMESQRLLDEARRKNAGPATSPQEKRIELLDRIRQVPGVVWAQLEQKSGARPASDRPDPNERRSAQLGALARVVGDRLRVDEVVGATVQGADRNLLLLATRAYHLLILIEGGPHAREAETEVRRLLAGRR
ncbi:MAG TPA: DUF4388 domain-containing protein [Anaeromyxobacteraceae bacterium]|nr:DUF4388 domain-containing protein [Anaeromyxobacteraceae bacterium]